MKIKFKILGDFGILGGAGGLGLGCFQGPCQSLPGLP